MFQPKRHAWLAVLVLTAGAAMSSSVKAQSETSTGKPFLVGATELKKELERSAPKLTIIDVRTQDAFAEAHIPGARWIDTNPWREKSLTETGLTDSDFWQQELGKLGLQNGSAVVVVGDSLPEVARVSWLLRFVGQSDVRLLDGGMKHWTLAKLPVTSESTTFETTTPDIKLQLDLLAEIDDVSPAANQKNHGVVLDNRSSAEFTGSRGVGTRVGHIPGAKHIEWSRFVDTSGKFLSATEIQSVLKNDGIDINQPIIVHCQTGGRSSVAVVALEIAGAKQVKNYYRGWSEYAGALTAPVEK